MSKKIETTLGNLIKEAIKTEKLTIDELYEKLVDIQYKKNKKKKIKKKEKIKRENKETGKQIKIKTNKQRQTNRGP